jgi:lysophospholipase L1-like esterase
MVDRFPFIDDLICPDRYGNTTFGHPEKTTYMKRIPLLVFLSLSTAFVAMSQCSEPSQRKVLLVGDSWAFFMGVDQTINTVLERWGHSNYTYFTNLTLAENGAETDDFQTAAKQNEIAAQLAANPSIEVVHLSIGGNDVLGDWNVSFTQAQTDSLKAAVFARLVDVIEFIKSARPGIRILWSGYMYPNFGEVIASAAPLSSTHPFYSTWSGMGFPTFIQLNEILNDFSDQIEAYTQADPQLDFVKAPGLMQYTFGQNSALLIPPGGTYPPLTQPLPYGDPTYPSPRNSMRDYLLTKDCFHLSAGGYRDMISYHTQKFYHKFLMNDQYFLSEGGTRDGSVSSSGVVSTALKMGTLNGETFSTVISFNTSGMDQSSVESAQIFLRRESLEGTNPISGSMQLKVVNGFFGSSVDVEAEDVNSAADASGVPCRFGSNGGNGHWIKLRVPDALLPFITTDGTTQFILSAPNATGGVVTFTGAADPDFAPVLDVTFGLTTTTPGVDLVQAPAAPSIYPNPTNGLLTIETDGVPVLEVQVIDLASRVQLRNNDRQYRVDLSALPAGTYLVKLTTERGVTTHRVVKW